MLEVHPCAADKIVVLADKLFLVCGKLFTFSRDVFDVSREDAALDVVDMALSIYTAGFTVPRLYGDRSVCALAMRPGTKDVMVAVYPLEALPDECRGLARKAVGLDV